MKFYEKAEMNKVKYVDIFIIDIMNYEIMIANWQIVMGWAGQAAQQ